LGLLQGNVRKEFQIHTWIKEIKERVKFTLRREKPGRGIGDTDSCGVESTQELENPMEES
jgi:hypothetical protein